MKMQHIRRLSVIVLLLTVMGGGLILAQTPTPSPDELRCDLDDLITTQTQIQQQFEDFEDQLNTDPQSTLADLFAAGQVYQDLATGCGYIPEDIGARYVGDDLEYVLTALETINGDPLNGQLLYNNEVPAADGSPLGCIGCHSSPSTAPLTEGTWTRWDEIYSQLPEFEDHSFEQYMVSSIIDPWAFTSGDYPENTMPNNFGSRLSYQDLADLIAYLESQDQLLP